MLDYKGRPIVCSWRDCSRTDIVAWTDMSDGHAGHPMFWCPEHERIIIERNPPSPPQPVTDEAVEQYRRWQEAWKMP